jgi:hypothetical protein
MPLIRPALAARLHRWREVLAGLAVVALGLWLAAGSGPFLTVLGLAVAALGAMLALVGLRRVRFRAGAAAEGVVQIDEGQITYLSAQGGGFVALSEMTALSLGPNGAYWLLHSADGAALAIPRGAVDADLLFDTFAALPGLDMGAVLAALAQGRPATRVLWRRDARAGLTIARSRAT